MSEQHYEFVVIGGGSAGYAAAALASRQGLKTAVIDGGKEIGGLCILRGCMPSKTLLESAARATSIRRAAEFGLRAEYHGPDGEAIRARKRKLIGEFASYRKEQLETGKFAFLRGKAHFVSAQELEVKMLDGGTLKVRGETFLIATGSAVNEIDIPGLCETGFMTSDDVLDSAHIPRSVVVLGGGAIGVEAASYYHGLGTRVTIVQRNEHLVKEMDCEVSEALAEAFRADGIEVLTGTELLRAEKTHEGKCVHLRQGTLERAVAAEEIIYALGRHPCTASLRLANAGVQATKRGTIEITCSQQSSVPHIFAAGDACGPYEVVHLAIQQAELAARNAVRLVKKKPEPLEEMDYALKLFAVFSHPEAASVGLTAQEASEMEISFVEASYPFAEHGKSVVRGETAGFVKLIAESRTRRIIGAAVIGPEAAELIHEISVAMYFKATAGDLAQVPHYHPTLSEIWTYPAEALAEFEGIPEAS
jgi:pyruvate/2-oxoglutarate dehydrogenase complex dihydrolipoamide dehydrogenase (E3) component